MQSVPTSIWEFAAPLQNDHRFGLLLASILAVVLMVAILAGLFYAIYKTRLTHALKRELLERGMSADEIVAVIQAKPDRIGSIAPPLREGST